MNGGVIDRLSSPPIPIFDYDNNEVHSIVAAFHFHHQVKLKLVHQRGQQRHLKLLCFCHHKEHSACKFHLYFQKLDGDKNLFVFDRDKSILEHTDRFGEKHWEWHEQKLILSPKGKEYELLAASLRGDINSSSQMDVTTSRLALATANQPHVSLLLKNSFISEQLIVEHNGDLGQGEAKDVYEHLRQRFYNAHKEAGFILPVSRATMCRLVKKENFITRILEDHTSALDHLSKIWPHCKVKLLVGSPSGRFLKDQRRADGLTSVKTVKEEVISTPPKRKQMFLDENKDEHNEPRPLKKMTPTSKNSKVCRESRAHVSRKQDKNTVNREKNICFLQIKMKNTQSQIKSKSQIDTSGANHCVDDLTDSPCGPASASEDTYLPFPRDLLGSSFSKEWETHRWVIRRSRRSDGRSQAKEASSPALLFDHSFGDWHNSGGIPNIGDAEVFFQKVHSFLDRCGKKDLTQYAFYCKGAGAKGLNKVIVARKSLATLKKRGEWVNDEIVNAFVDIINSRVRKHVSSLGETEVILSNVVYCANSWVMADYLWKGEFDKVDSILSKCPGGCIFECRAVVIPVNENRFHWFSMVADFKERHILIYDSTPRRKVYYKEYTKKLLDYLHDRDRKMKMSSSSPFNLEPIFPSSYPVQRSCDCGVFTTAVMMDIVAFPHLYLEKPFFNAKKGLREQSMRLECRLKLAATIMAAIDANSCEASSVERALFYNPST